MKRTLISGLLLCLLLPGCISYQPRVLVPSLTFSAEDIEINPVVNNGELNSGVEFGLETVTNESDSLFNVEVLPGVRVRAVASGGPASVAGIQAGDVILRVNGVATNEPDTLAALAQQNQGQTEFLFQIRRNTAVLEANVIARPVSVNSSPPRELYRIDPLASKAGYRTELVTVQGEPDIAAARIVDILADSPLPAAGFAVDDIILAINGTSINSAQGLVTSLNTDFELGDTVSVTVFSNDQLLERNLSLWDPGRRISRVSLRPLLHYESTLNPQLTSFSFLDLWLFSVYRFERNAGEREHQLFEIFSFSSDYGELLEETQ